MYLIKGGFLFNTMYTGVKPFIHEVTKAKFRFLGSKFNDEFAANIDP
jgi:hypothetical protein